MVDQPLHHDSPFSSLPIELLIKILEHVWNRDQKALINMVNCSKVCSRWRPISQAMLFTEVNLPFEERAVPFFHALEGNPSLGKATRILDFRNGNSNQVVFWPSPSRIRAIVAHCPQLYQLVLGLSSTISRKQLGSLLPPHTLATLRALDLSFAGVPQDMKSLDIHDILHFLHRFSSISHLLLGNISFIRKADPDAQIPLPPSFELYEFMWINSNHSSVDSSKAAFCYIADWLFQKSPTCPRMFRLDDVDYVAQYEMLSYFLNNYGANLTSLWTMCRDRLICDHLAETCPKLRELVLFNSVLLSPEFRLTIPTTDLEHLGLFILTKGNHRREEYLEFIDWIVKIPNLVCLTQGAWGFREERDWEFAREWKSKCEGKIQVKFTSLLENSYFTCRDLIPTDHFPRESGALSNLSRMNIPSLSSSG